MKEQVFLAAVAGLLHDIGKFAQRQERKVRSHTMVGSEVFTRVIEQLFPRAWQDDIGDAIERHHSRKSDEKVIVKAVTVADWLASAERKGGYEKQCDPKATALLPVTAHVEFAIDFQSDEWGFPLKPLQLTPDAGEKGESPLFPRPVNEVETGEQPYGDLWQTFETALQTLPIPIDSYSRLNALMSVLRRYTTHVPSATPWRQGDDSSRRTVPDVSLYDHLKVTAAIAVCLQNLLPDHLNELHQAGWQQAMNDQRSVAQIIRGDISGIQSFIYRITEPEREREHRGAAKRLRGRSFYLSLLNEVVVDWFLRELNLTPANALFVGGGRFDLLVPVDKATTEKVNALTRDLQEWLFKYFEGTVGLVLVQEFLIPADFSNLGRATVALDAKLAEQKQRKFAGILPENLFARQEIHHVCEVCGLTPVSNEGQPCDLCILHAEIGQALPRTRYIARLYSADKLKMFDDKQVIRISFDAPLNTIVVLLPDEQAVKNLLKETEQQGIETVILSLNDEPTPVVNWGKTAAPAQIFLANAAPQDTRGGVLDFEKIAALSTGTKLLGILKADVDHLGLIFSLGLEPLTISRVASLSHIFDRFFAGYINTLCREATQEWKKKLSDNEKTDIEARVTQVGESNAPVKLDNLESLFYITYAGGDDLLIIGPWDQTIELAQALNEKFRAYTCHNPNITISAGITLVKPHFPVQRFVELADEALEKSKDGGRDRITVFGQTVEWHNGSLGFESLKKLADDLYGEIERKQMPRTLIHDMLRMRRAEIRTRQGEWKPMVTPKLLYLLTRRLPKSIRETYKKPLLDALDGIRIPLSYVSLKTRKE